MRTTGGTRAAILLAALAGGALPGAAAAAAPEYSWKTVLPAALADREQVGAVKAFGARDVWVFTHDEQAGAGAYPSKAHHWDGSRWQRYRLPHRVRVVATAGASRDLWVAATNDARGKAFDAVLRWNGTAWTTAKRLVRTGGPLTGLTVLGPRDVRLFSGSGKGTLAWRYDGSAWHRHRIKNLRLDDVAALSARNVWATRTSGGQKGVSLHRFDGTRWKRTSPPAALLACPAGLAPDCRVRFTDIAAASPSNVLVSVAFDYTAARILRWNGVKWTRLGPDAGTNLSGLVPDRSGGAYAIASDTGMIREKVVRYGAGGRVTEYPLRQTTKWIAYESLTTAPGGALYAASVVGNDTPYGSRDIPFRLISG